MSNVPKLRFKEFSGEYKQNTLNKLTDILRCGIAATPEYVDDGIVFLSSQNVTNDGKFNLDKFNYISEEHYEKISKNAKLLKGDILYSRVGAGYGNATIFPYEGQYGVYVSLTHIRANEKLDNTYLSYMLNSPVCKIQAKKGVFQGGGVPNLNVKIVEKFKINYPSKQEQEKIASFLTSVDSKIEQLTKKEELLSSYKKGVMQKIFSGEIKFKADDGSEFCEWEEKKLEQVLTEPKKIAVKNPNEIELLTVQLHCKGVKRSGNFPTVTRNGRPYYKRNKDELLIGRQNFHNGGIGIVNDETDGYICSNAITSLVAKKDNIQFLYLYLSRTDYYKKIDDLIGGTGQKEISKTELNKLEILVPCVEEQTKIANFLSSIDYKIEQVKKQLDSTKEFKKALLQQMFV